MTPPVPYFLRRLWHMLEARRALFEGEPERALGCLRDPSLALSPRADHLRQRAMDVLYRSAASRAAEGRDSSVARLLTVVAGEDPDRASEWRRRLRPAPESHERERPALQELLEKMRQQDPPEPAPPVAQPAVPRAESRVEGRPLRFHMAIDDGGEFLVLSGGSVTLGHAQASQADIPLLADLDSVHALLSWTQTFHAGIEWRIEARGRGVQVKRSPVEPGASRTLDDGDEVDLSPNLSFRFRRPEASSGSALLELLHGVESVGAMRVLLLTPGPSGCVRIGPHRTRHVPVAGLEHEVELTLTGEQLKIACSGGVRLAGLQQEAQTAVEVECPPAARCDVTANARPSQRPPFGIALSPVVASPGRGAAS